MKFLSLKIQGFGPYNEQVTIPFSKLQGLFTITGDTGAGKSTIFDALTFALYGEMSGSSRDPADARCTLSSEKCRTEVILKFIHLGTEYTVRRYLKRSTNAAGWKVEGEISGGSISESVNRAVNDAVRGLIGLDAEQWRMIAVLPQGEFSKLLQADQDKRSDIIKKIFNTVRYGKYVDSLDKMSKAASDAVDACRTEIVGRVTPIKAEEGELADMVRDFSVDKNMIHNLDHLLELLEAQNEADSEYIGGEEAEIGKLNVIAERLAKEYNDAVSVREKYGKVLELEKEFDELDLRKDEIAALQKETLRSENAVNVVSRVAEVYDRALSKLEECRKSIKVKSGEHEELSGKIEEYSKKAELAKKEREANNHLAGEREYLVNSMGIYETADKNRRAILQAEKELGAIDATLKENDRKRQAYQKSKSENDEFLHQNEDLSSLIVKAEGEESDEKRIINGLKILLEDCRKYLGDKSKVAELLEKLERENRKHLELQAEADGIEAAIRRNKYGLIARDYLREGAPCPICGSLNHPSPALMFEGEISEEKLDEVNAYLIEHSETISGIKVELGKYEGALDSSRGSISARFAEYGVEGCVDDAEALSRIGNQLDVHKTAHGLCSNRLSEMKDLSEKADSCRRDNEVLAKKINELDESDKASNTRKNALAADIQSANAVLSSLDLKYGSEDEAKSRVAEIDSVLGKLDGAVRDSDEKLKDLKDKISQKKGELDIETGHLNEYSDDVVSHSEEFEKALSECGFGSHDDYDACNKDMKVIEENRKKIRDYNNQVLVNQGKLQNARAELEGKGVPKTHEELSVMETARDEARKIHTEASGRLEVSKFRLKGNRDAHRALVVLGKKYADLDKYASRVAFVNNTAHGNVTGSKKMITYDAYVQEQYFQSIVADADLRFYELSGHTMRLYSKSADGDSLNKKNLKLWIHDLRNNGDRVVNSLSGGETFMASLCLALGMSDMIQRCAGGNSIESLFIDEGFGTLDKDILSKAISLLAKVAGTKGSIGLITHLDDLIAAVPKRMDVTKDDLKGSDIRIL